jgi:hypothetical protein
MYAPSSLRRLHRTCKKNPAQPLHVFFFTSAAFPPSLVSSNACTSMYAPSSLRRLHRTCKKISRNLYRSFPRSRIYPAAPEKTSLLLLIAFRIRQTMRRFHAVAMLTGTRQYRVMSTLPAVAPY